MISDFFEKIKRVINMGHQDEIMMFSSRNLWYEIGIHPDKITKIVCQKIGENEKEIRERERHQLNISQN